MSEFVSIVGPAGILEASLTARKAAAGGPCCAIRTPCTAAT
ncbi:MAG: hypothetical protein R3E84_07655 [Pseudomonadales bacterium]